jgi:phage shock protein E
MLLRWQRGLHTVSRPSTSSGLLPSALQFSTTLLPGKAGLLPEKEQQTRATMNTSLRIDAAPGAGVANQAPMISSAIIKAEQSTKETVSSLNGSSIRKFAFFRFATHGLSFALARVRRCQRPESRTPEEWPRVNDQNAFIKAANEAKSRIIEITAMELAKKKLHPVIIDVREEEEFLTGQICGAKHLSQGSLNEGIGHIVSDLTTPILVYCSRGDRGALAADSLQKMGYQNVHSLKGGLQHWLEAGGTLECPVSRRKTSAQISHPISIQS